jgi:hypothetical protein
MSQVLRRDPFFLDPVVEHLIERIKASAQHRIVQCFLGHDLREARAQEPIIGAGAEEERSTPLPRHPIAMGPSDPLDQAVQAKSPQVVRHLTRCHVVGRLPQQGGPTVPQVAVGETSGQETEHQQRAEQRLHRHVGEPQAAGALPTDLDRFIDTAERVLADGTVLADSLDVEKTSVGVEADPPQGGQVAQPFADAEVAVSLIVVSVRRARPSLWYCLIRECL